MAEKETQKEEKKQVAENLTQENSQNSFLTKKITPSDTNRRRKKVIGRGVGSGKGRTATKGHKGYKARSGNGKNIGFEGGQMPLIRRLPKVGFSNYAHKITYSVVNLDSLEKKIADGETVDPIVLKKRQLISTLKHPVKVLGKGSLSKTLTFSPEITMSKTVKENSKVKVVEKD